jgi:flagellar biosynthesis anti-sigma factor FlgM
MKGITGNPALDAYHRMAISPVSAARPAERAEQSPSQGTGSNAAQVSISARARDLATEVTGQLDPAKIETLRQRIADGSYRVDSQAVASKMIELLG